MGLVWTLFAGFLYFEIFLVIVFLLPFISPLTWRKCFKSRLLALLSTYSSFYAKFIVVALFVAFVDSLIRLHKYSDSIEKLEENPGMDAGNMNQRQHLHLFLAQRNVYISGFSLFLWLVLSRLVTLITSQAQLMADYEATKKQAMSANDAAQQFMKDAMKNNEAGDASVDSKEHVATVKVLQSELKSAKKELQVANSSLETARTDLKAMESQAEATKREYDRLLEDYAKIQAKIEANDGSKKDN